MMLLEFGFILTTGIENHLEMIACIMKSLWVAVGRKRLLILAQYGTWFLFFTYAFVSQSQMGDVGPN